MLAGKNGTLAGREPFEAHDERFVGQDAYGTDGELVGERPTTGRKQAPRKRPRPSLLQPLAKTLSG